VLVNRRNALVPPPLSAQVDHQSALVPPPLLALANRQSALAPPPLSALVNRRSARVLPPLSALVNRRSEAPRRSAHRRVPTGRRDQVPLIDLVGSTAAWPWVLANRRKYSSPKRVWALANPRFPPALHRQSTIPMLALVATAQHQLIHPDASAQADLPNQ
jgi:hypothetical protein